MLVPSDLDPRGPVRKTLDWLTQARGHRVWCLLAGLWLINVFDLLLTLQAYEQGLLQEANPVARRLLPLGPHVLAVFKLTLVGGASLVLLRYRRVFLAEVTAWTMLLLYVAVAVRWRLCYELYILSCNSDSASADIDHLDNWAAALPVLWPG